MKSIVLLKAGTHKADVKEQEVTKANGRIASDQKSAREHTAQTTADGKLTHAFYACVREVSCLFQQVSIVYIHHSKRETETKI